MRWIGMVLSLGVSLPASAADAPALRAGILAAAPPFIVSDSFGRPSGFTVQLFKAIGARLHRKVIFTTGSVAELQAGVEGGRFDVLPGPILATPEHAATLLFLEGYAWSAFQFGAPPKTPVLTLGDLRGRRLAVEAGSEYAEWAGRNAARLGFSVVSLPDQGAVLDAMRHGKAEASLTGSAALRGQAGLAAGLSLPETRTQETAAVREGETELRDELEDALVCLKLDGSVAKLAKTWFGEDPAPEDLERLVVPGYGVPGLAGYDAKPRKPPCRS